MMMMLLMLLLQLLVLMAEIVVVDVRVYVCVCDCVCALIPPQHVAKMSRLRRAAHVVCQQQIVTAFMLS